MASTRARVSGGRAGGQVGRWSGEQIRSGLAREGRYLVEAVEGDLVSSARPDRRRGRRRRLSDHLVGARGSSEVVVLVAQRRAATAYDPAAIGQDRAGSGEGSEMGKRV